MFTRKYGVCFCALGLTLFLYACGDLGMVLPSQGSYRVSARVKTPKDDFAQDPAADKSKDDYTLDIYSIVNKHSEIQPYFVNSVANDPDVRGLTVFVQDYSGTIVSRKVLYQLPLDEGEEQTPPDDPESSAENPQEAAGTENPGGTGNPAEGNPEEAGENVSPSESAGESSISAVTETVRTEFPGTESEPWPGESESSAESGAGFDAPVAELTTTSPADIFGGNGGDATEAAPVETAPAPSEIAGAPDNAETGTGDPANAETGGSPDNAETGDSGVVRDTGTDALRPDTAAPEAPPVVSPPEEKPDPVIPEDQIVPVKQLDQYLPGFWLTEDLEIGRYNLVFQVMGKEKDVILYKTFKPIYFLGDAKFTLEDIQSFLPMAVTEGRLIPMGINVMLKTEIRADERLDPYVIWHNGKKVLAQGRVSSGANYLLWETPEKTGFHNIRVEVFPLLPGERVPENMIGKIKELSLPVSSKAEGKTQFDGYESSAEFIGWYQFWGTLLDAKAPDKAERKLVPLHLQSPRWIPFNAMYSLFVGRDDSYLLPGTPFKLAQGEEGTGRILLHLAALSEGSILSIRFAGQENPPRKSTDQAGSRETADGTAELDLFLAGDALILRILSENVSREQSLALDKDSNGKFIMVVLEFVIAPDRFEAKLRLENPAKTTGLLSVVLAKPISGEGSIRLGGGESPTGYKRSANLPVFDGSGTFSGGTMALNELAFSYDRLTVPENGKESVFEISESLSLKSEEPGVEQEPPSLSAL
ncbi:MAG: hypothetical protein LBK63_13150 [Treponema sp.]|jgi:hypothetical protein|nr:hypothetical protein [Treponema sp.]